MPTTIQVDAVAKQRLDILKREYNAASYNEVILRMTGGVSEARKMFGSLKGIGPWTKTDRARSKYE